MHLHRRTASLAAQALLVGFSLSSTAAAQGLFANQVVAFNQGGGGGIFDTANILGGPQGGGLGSGSLDVLTLGEGGDIVLGFEGDLVDGPGADFTVFENGFVLTGSAAVFAEILFVEVSTDGANFARFPSSYVGSGSDMGSYRGLAGGLPVLANVATNSVSPFDPAISGGEAFDLAELALHPLVQAGTVDLQAIRFVRLVDALVADTDSQGTPLMAFGGSDVDAVAAIHSDQTDLTTQPVCDLSQDVQGRLVLRLGDPDGFFDLDLATLNATFNLESVPVLDLLQSFTVQSASANELVLVTPPLQGTGVLGAFGISIADLSGARSGDQCMLQG
ncbi:MAG: hypothetical protein ACYS26_04935 [Planctomycetota bacterium]|jgi:hypothetical protein